jgi:hypothetical protein
MWIIKIGDLMDQIVNEGKKRGDHSFSLAVSSNAASSDASGSRVSFRHPLEGLNKNDGLITATTRLMVGQR